MSDNMDMPVNSNANDVAEAHGIGISAAALQTRGRARQEVGIVIQEELAIAGVTESSFAALREEADALSTLEPKSDADIAALQKVITKGTRLCTTISEAIEPGKKWAHALHKAYTSNENEFIGTVKAIIEPLKAKKGTYVARKEQEEREALEARERLIRARFTALEGFGFTRRTAMAGGEDLYINGETTIAVAYVTAADDMVWGNVLKGIEIAWNEEQDRIKAAEEAKAAEAERIRLAQEDIERKQRELKEQQDAFNAKINEARANEMVSIGMYRKPNGNCVYLTEEGRGYTYPVEQLHSFENWEKEVEMVRSLVAERDDNLRKEREIAECKALIAERVKALKEAGWVDAELDGEDALALFVENDIPYKCVAVATLHEEKNYIFNEWVDRGWTELLRRKKAEEERIAAEAVERERQRAALQAKLDEEARIENEKRAQEAEAQRIAAMGDVEHLNRFYDALSKLGVEMYNQLLTSEIAKHGVKKALPHLDHAMSVINGVLEDLRK